MPSSNTDHASAEQTIQIVDTFVSAIQMVPFFESPTEFSFSRAWSEELTKCHHAQWVSYVIRFLKKIIRDPDVLV